MIKYICIVMAQMNTMTIFCAILTLHFATETSSQYLNPGAMYSQMAQMHMPMGASSLSMPYQGQIPMQQPRLPIMVMPFQSKTSSHKHRTHKKRKEKYLVSSSSSTSDSDETSNSREFYMRASHKKGKKKRQVLTPVISYVTNKGRVVYQKKIKKENVGNWLGVGQNKIPSELEQEKFASREMTVRDLKHRYGLKKKHEHEH